MSGPRSRACLVALAVLFIGSCATRPPLLSPGAPGELRALDISGKISVKQGKSANFAGVRWHHAIPNHDITILSPLGQTVARVVQNGDGVTLSTADKAQYHASDADSLMQQVLGWSLPLTGMQYWVLGRAAPGDPAEVVNSNDQRVTRINQDDWQIDYANYRPVGNGELPGRIVMQHGDVQIRVVIDSWTVLPDRP
jgi:outer membrane lipoprotein LolB